MLQLSEQQSLLEMLASMLPFGLFTLWVLPKSSEVKVVRSLLMASTEHPSLAQVQNCRLPSAALLSCKHFCTSHVCAFKRGLLLHAVATMSQQLSTQELCVPGVHAGQAHQP